jgi:hypothetical protein
MIDSQTETLFPLAKGPSGTGRSVSAATMWRWAQKGVRGIRLETLRVGGRRYSSVEAYERFLVRLNEPAGAKPDVPSRQRADELNAATRRADDLFERPGLAGSVSRRRSAIADERGD